MTRWLAPLVLAASTVAVIVLPPAPSWPMTIVAMAAICSGWATIADTNNGQEGGR